MTYVFMKVGPKGQVVIPKVFRDEYDIGPGQEVVFENKVEHGEQELVLKKKTDDFIKFLREFNRRHGIKGFEYDSDEAYEEMMAERHGTLLKKLSRKAAK